MNAVGAAAFGIALLAAGCVAPQYVVPPPARTADVESARMAALVAPYPAEFRISQHIILSVNGKEYDFTGYLAVKPDGFHAVSYGDMGGKLFDMVEANGKREILFKPEGMPSGPLLDGVMGDIRHLFMAQCGGAYTSAPREKGFGVMCAERNRFSEFVFSDAGELASSAETENGKPLREAAYSGYRVFDGWAKPLPARIVLVNRRYQYQLRIELLKIAAASTGFPVTAP